MLVQHHEATGDDRTLWAVEASLRALGPSVAGASLFTRGRSRWLEGLIPIFYVYEQTRDPWLLELAHTLRAEDADYTALHTREAVTVPTPRRGRGTLGKHAVNYGMSPKAAALSWRLDRWPDNRAFPARMLGIIDHYHGQLTGKVTGDECLAGNNQHQGDGVPAAVGVRRAAEAFPVLRSEGTTALTLGPWRRGAAPNIVGVRSGIG